MQGSPQGCFSLGIAPSDALVQSRSKWKQIKENSFRALGVFLSPPCTLLSAYSRRLVAMDTSAVYKLLIERKAPILWAKKKKKRKSQYVRSYPNRNETNKRKKNRGWRSFQIHTNLSNKLYRLSYGRIRARTVGNSLNTRTDALTYTRSVWASARARTRPTLLEIRNVFSSRKVLRTGKGRCISEVATVSFSHESLWKW